MTLQTQLDELHYYNGWLTLPHVEVYVRKNARILNNVKQAVLDIANVNVHKGHRREGHFKAFLEEAESLGMTLYIENVIEEWFREFFLRRGYTFVETLPFPSYYKEFRNGP